MYGPLYIRKSESSQLARSSRRGRRRRPGRRVGRISRAAVSPVSQPPSMKPWAACEQCSPAKWRLPARSPSAPELRSKPAGAGVAAAGQGWARHGAGASCRRGGRRRPGRRGRDRRRSGQLLFAVPLPIPRRAPPVKLVRMPWRPGWQALSPSRAGRQVGTTLPFEPAPRHTLSASRPQLGIGAVASSAIALRLTGAVDVELDVAQQGERMARTRWSRDGLTRGSPLHGAAEGAVRRFAHRFEDHSLFDAVAEALAESLRDAVVAQADVEALVAGPEDAEGRRVGIDHQKEIESGLLIDLEPVLGGEGDVEELAEPAVDP